MSEFDNDEYNTGEDKTSISKVDENKLKRFRELLMKENINILSKKKQFKSLDFRRKLILSQKHELKKLSELSKIWVSVPFNDMSFNYPVISVDSSKAGSNTDALRLAINDLGWKEYPNGRSQRSCHVVWNSCNFNDNKSNTGSYLNKFPGISQCLHKVGFTRILETMHTLFPEHYSFYPQTWYLPHQMVDFVVYCKTQKSDSTIDKYYIVKPDSGTQGKGIYLIKKPKEYKMSSKNYVVQEYLDRPLLLDGYKFDLRIYVVLLSLDPLKVFICNDGLARFCTHKYFNPTTSNHSNNFMHLTNYSLNKKSNQFIHTQKDYTGSKRTMSSVFALLESRGCDVGSIWKKLEELVYKTILAIVPQLKVHYVTEVMGKKDDLSWKYVSTEAEKRPTCFQILGFDVLIMDDLRPILLEVNSNPSLRLDCEMEIAPGIYEYYLSKVDIKVKRPLVKDTLKLLEKDIANKFHIEIRAEKDYDEIHRAPEILSITSDNSSNDICKKVSFEEIVAEWDMNCDFGPYFVEIAKQNNLLPPGFRLSRSNSVNDNIDPNNSLLNGDSNVSSNPALRNEQLNRRLERLAREKHWLNNCENERYDDSQITEFAILRQKSAKSQSDCDPQEKTCLSLISSQMYKSIFDKLRILEETTVIFFHAMGCKYTENMGATTFRTFARRCNLHQLGLSHAMIDLIFIQVQRHWSFLTNYESTEGLCYQAFLEAFFRIAFDKYSKQSKIDAVHSLIEHCKMSIGPENLNWTQTLFPTKELLIREKLDYNKFVRPLLVDKENLSVFSPSPQSIKSTVSVNSESSNIRNKTLSKQSKYDLMKALHQTYTQKLRIPQSSKLVDIDSDSMTSLPGIDKHRVKRDKSVLVRRLDDLGEGYANSISRADSRFKVYHYDSAVRDDSKKSIKYHQYPQIKAEKSYKTVDSGRNATSVKERRHSNDWRKGLHTAKDRNNRKELTPLYNGRMLQLISVYGGTGNLLRSTANISAEKVDRRIKYK